MFLLVFFEKSEVIPKKVYKKQNSLKSFKVLEKIKISKKFYEKQKSLKTFIENKNFLKKLEKPKVSKNICRKKTLIRRYYSK